MTGVRGGMDEHQSLETPQEGPPRIPTPGSIALEAYAIWRTNLGLWFRLSLFPLIVVIGGAALIWFFVPLEAPTASNSSAMSYKVSLGFTFAVLLAELPLVTAWHRLILLRGDQGAHRYIFGHREWRYLLNAAIVGTGMVLVAAGFYIGTVLLFGEVTFGVRSEWMLTFLAILFDLALWSFVIYCFAGLLLRLPAAAIGRRHARVATSRGVKGNRWRLLRSYFAALWPLGVIVFLIEVGLSDTDGVPVFVLETLHRLVFLTFAPVLVGVLSITFRELVQKPETIGTAISPS